MNGTNPAGTVCDRRLPWGLEAFMVWSCRTSNVAGMTVQAHLGSSALPVRVANPTVGVAPHPIDAPGFARLNRSARRHSVLLACLATLGVHLMSLTRELGVDEGGFAVVARNANATGPYLYGPLWVDRPPGLIAVFSLAQHLGPFGVRIMAALLAVVLVAAVAAAAGAVGGRTSARWAAWTAFALASSALLEAQRLNGELAAATFVAISVAAVVRAVRVSPKRTHTMVCGVVAGAAAMSAVLMKQNFLDAFVFAGVLLGLGSVTRANRLTYRLPQVLMTAGTLLAGAAIPGAAAVLWAVSHGGVNALLYAAFGFRGDAAAVIAQASFQAPLRRLGALAVVALLSGLLLLLGHLVVAHRRRLRRLDPLTWAVVATTGVELVGVAGGENFWSHYLIGLIPMIAVSAGLAVHHRMPGAGWTRRLVVLMAVSTAVVSPVAAVSAAHTPSAAYTAGRWVAASAGRADTLTVTWTHANVINASGLRPAYPFAWSLPLRTLDPHLNLLITTLKGPDAPTWLIRWDPAHPWGLDPGNRVDGVLHEHYRNVATVCGRQVWLHEGVTRQLAPTPTASACGAGAR